MVVAAALVLAAFFGEGELNPDKIRRAMANIIKLFLLFMVQKSPLTYILS